MVPDDVEKPPNDAVGLLLAEAGITARRIREVIALLTESPRTLASLVQASAVDRRTVESVLDALGDDIIRDDGQLRIAAGAVRDLHDLIEYAELRATTIPDPLAAAVAKHADLITTVEGWITALPRARQALDHVSATAETAVRRALWLDRTYDLRGARVLCIGDHDLTSLALAAVNPHVEIAVVDVDDRILRYIDEQGTTIRCLWGDFRFGLPDGVREWGDVVFTDPPYTPDGIRLFLARGVEGLRDRGHGRLILSYGFGTEHPGLGLKVQQAIGDLRLVYEAILPSFNRYHGAQAVGSASDLYILRPTGHTPAGGASRGKRAPGTNIYTHGAQSLEGSGPPPEIIEAVRAAAAPDATMIGGNALAGLLAGERGGTRTPVALDLSADPGGWLVRALLALDAPRAAVLVPNSHPDLGDAAAQAAFTGLFAAKWRLRLRRSTPGPTWAIVEAVRVDPAKLDAAASVTRGVLDRAHGKLGNVWRESLIRAGRDAGHELTKREAAGLVAAQAGGLVDEQLISLPRHRLDNVPERITASVVALGTFRGTPGII